jgi:protein O-GlcNAc transferase
MAADIMLDTVVKNGHTSSADALWAGVPVVTLAGVLPHARVTASLLTNAGQNVNVTLAVSAKDYEDVYVVAVLFVSAWPLLDVLVFSAAL